MPFMYIYFRHYIHNFVMKLKLFSVYATMQVKVFLRNLIFRSRRIINHYELTQKSNFLQSNGRNDSIKNCRLINMENGTFQE